MKYQNFVYPRVFPISILGALLLCAIPVVAPRASAATGTWTGTNNAVWDTNASNWSGVSGTPWSSVNGLTNDAVFNTGGTPIINVGGTVYSKSITFSSSAIIYNVSGNTSGGINFGTNSTISVASGQSGFLYASMFGSGTLTKSGSGNLTVFNQVGFGANTFNGAVVVDGGILYLNAGGSGASGGRALSSASSYTINSGATIAMLGNDPMGSGPITINSATLRHETGSAFFQSVGALTLNGGTVLSAQGAGASFQGLALNGNVTVGGSSASTIGTQESVNNGVHLLFNSAAANRTFNVADATGNAAPDLTVSASLLNSSHTGNAAGLIKTGAGLMLLTGSNSYTGATTISNGILVFQNKNTRAGGSAVTAAAAGTVGLGVGAGGVSDYSESDVASLFNSTLSGFTLDAASGVAIDTTAGNFTQSTALTAARALTKLGANTLTLTASNTYTGGTTVGLGTLQLSNGGSLAGNITNNATFLINRTDSSTVTNVVSGSGALTKAGAGTVILTASNSYSGGTTLSDGTLRVGNNNALGTGSLSVANTSGTTLASDGSTARTLSNALAMNAGARVIFGDGTGTGAMTLTGPVSLANGSVQVMTAAVDTTISGLISGTNTGGLVKAGTGVLTLSNTANTFSSPIGVHQGWLRVTKLSDTGVASSIGTSSNSIQLGQVGVEGTLDYIGTGDTMNLQVQIGNGDVGASGGARINNNGSGALVFTNSAFNVNPGVADTAALTRSLTLAGTNTAANEIRGVIANTSSNKATAVVKGDAGTWVLSGANTYSGGTSLGAGTLRVGNNSALGTGTFTLGSGFASTFASDGASARTITNAITMGGDVQLGDATGTGALTLSGNLNLGTNSRTFTVSNNTTLAGAITNTGGLTKAGSGTLYVTAPSFGANTFSGPVVVNAGTLQVGAGNSSPGLGFAGSLTYTINSGATLISSGNDPVYNGTFTINGGTLRNNPAAAAYATLGAVTLNAGTLTSGTGAGAAFQGFSLNGDVTVGGTNVSTINTQGGANSGIHLAFNSPATNRTFNVADATGSAAADLIVSAQLIDSSHTGNAAGLIKTGAGLMLLSASNTYTGGTTISAGTLEFTNGGSVAGNITNNASLSINRTDSSTLTNTVSGSGALTKSGTGTLTLAGANSYNGVTTVSAGVLRVSSSGALGSTNGGTTVANGAQLRFFNGAGNWFYGDGETLNISGNAGANGGAIRSGGAAGETNTFQGRVVLDDTAQIQNNGSVLIFDVSSGDGVDLKGFNLISTNSGTTEFRDAIVSTGGGGSLTKAGSGTTVLSASNSYSGATDIQAGRLTLSGDGRLASGAITISNANNGTLELAVTGTNVMANNISGAGALLSSSGETRFTGAVTTTGGLTVSGSTVRIGNGGTSGSFSGNTVVTNAGLLVFDRSNAYAHSGTISGSGSVTKFGAGTTTLTGNNSFSGALAVNAGVLELNASSGAAASAASTVSVATNAVLLVSKSNQVNDSAAVTLSGGTITRASGVSEVFGNLNLTAASFLDFGSGTAGTIGFGTYTPSALTALNIANFTQGNTLTFRSDLTSSIETGAFVFSGSGGLGSYSWDSTSSTFTITAIPEPSTVAAALGLCALLGWPVVRRRFDKRKI